MTRFTNMSNNYSANSNGDHTNTQTMVTLRSEIRSTHSELWQCQKRLADIIDQYLYSLDDVQYTQHVFKQMRKFERACESLASTFSLTPYLGAHALIRALYTGSHHRESTYAHARLRYGKEAIKTVESLLAHIEEFRYQCRQAIDSMSFRERTHYGADDMTLIYVAKELGATTSSSALLGYCMINHILDSEKYLKSSKGILGLNEFWDALGDACTLAGNSREEVLSGDKSVAYVLSRLGEDEEFERTRVAELRAQGRDCLGTSHSAHLSKIVCRERDYESVAAYVKLFELVTIADLITYIEQCYNDSTNFIHDVEQANTPADEEYNFRMQTEICCQEFRRKLGRALGNITIFEDCESFNGGNC